MYEPTRGGTRGGQAEFKWSDVSADKDRENYLGHSINAPTGRWQRNKDVHWYNRDVNDTAEWKQEELRRIKEAEKEALAVALGFQPSKPAAGVAPATGSNAISASQPSAGPSNGYITALAAATVLHSDDENLNPDVALRRKEKEEKKRQKAEKKAAKEEKKRIEEELRERRAMESVGRDRGREGLYERKSRRDDRRGWDRGDDNRHRRRGERQLTPLEDRPWVENQQRNSRSRSPPPRRPRSLDRERRGARRDEPYDEVSMVRERERDRRRWEDSSRRREGGIDYPRR